MSQTAPTATASREKEAPESLLDRLEREDAAVVELSRRLRAYREAEFRRLAAAAENGMGC